MYSIVHQPNPTTTPQFRNSIVELVCRTCLKNCATHLDIFNHRRDNILVADMLVCLTSLEIRNDDRFPIGICNNCMELLASAFDFKTMVIESSTKLCELHQGEGIIKEEGLCNNGVEDIPIHEDFLKTEQSILTDLHCKNKDTLGNQGNNHEIDVKIKLEFESLEEDGSFVNNSAGISCRLGPLETEKDGKVNHAIPVVDLPCETKVVRNRGKKQGTGVTAQSKFETLDEDGNFLNDSAGISFRLGLSETEKYGKVNQITPVADVCCETKGIVGNQTSEQAMDVAERLKFESSDENDSVSDDSTGGSSSSGDLSEKCEKTLQSIPDAKQGNNNEKHADLLDNLEYRRIISNSSTNKLRKLDTAYCTKEYRLTQYLRSDFLTKVFPCKTCGKVFHKKQELQSHRRLKHSEERPYKCNLCARRFKKPSNATRHALIHAKGKIYTCELCEKAFASKSKFYNRHLNTHTAVKSLICEICGKAFTESGLKQHMHSHSAQRYQCKLCPSNFKYPTSLRRHENMHGKERVQKETEQKCSDVDNPLVKDC